MSIVRIYTTGSGITVAEHILHWLDQRKEAGIQNSTYRNYTSTLKPILITFKDVQLTELSTADVQRIVDSLELKGKKRMAHHMMSLLKAALEEAVKEGKIAENPARNVKLQPSSKQEAPVLTVEMQRLFQEAIQDHRLQNLFEFQLATGLRPGEVIALHWSDVDFAKKSVSIHSGVRRESQQNDTTKLVLAPTKSKGCYELALSEIAVRILKDQKTQQRKEQQKNGYEVTDLIFTTRKGTIIEESSLNRTLKSIQKKMLKLYAEQMQIPEEEAILAPFTAHTLRHTFATRALEAGVSLKVVSGLLGHSSVRTTGDFYTHVLPESTQNAVKQMEMYLLENRLVTNYKSSNSEK